VAEISLVDALAALPTTGVLAFVVILMLRGDLIPRRSHDALLERCSEELAKSELRVEEWRDLAMDALNVTEAATKAAAVRARE
jgi:hypothetical protein